MLKRTTAVIATTIVACAALATVLARSDVTRNHAPATPTPIDTFDLMSNAPSDLPVQTVDSAV